VTAKGVAVEFSYGFYNIRTKGIQVYVPDQREKVIVFVAEYGFVAVLEQVSGALMTAVVVLCVPGEQFSHNCGDAVLATLEKDMNMVVHEDPGINRAFPLYYILSESFKKLRLVLIVVEYVGLVDSPHHDMVQGPRYIQSRLAWHGTIVLKR